VTRHHKLFSGTERIHTPLDNSSEVEALAMDFIMQPPSLVIGQGATAATFYHPDRSIELLYIRLSSLQNARADCLPDLRRYVHRANLVGCASNSHSSYDQAHGIVGARPRDRADCQIQIKNAGVRS
jgi:hypothetical protein